MEKDGSLLRRKSITYVFYVIIFVTESHRYTKICFKSISYLCDGYVTKWQKLKVFDCNILSLKKQGLVEGRYPNLFVAARIAAATGMKARYIRDKSFDKNIIRI